MDVSSVPWDKPLGVVFAICLLIIFVDLTYRKIPRAMRKMQIATRIQTRALTKESADTKALLAAVVTSIERLDTAIASLLEMQEETEDRRVPRRPRRSSKSKRA